MIKYNVNTCDQIFNELQIHFTKSCPNRCLFCVDSLNKGLEKRLKEPDVDAIYKRILCYKDNIDSVCISGGEPMLFILHLLELIMLLKQNTNLKVYIISSIPDICFKQRNIFKKVLELCDSLAISPQHYKEDIADKIRGHKSTFDIQSFYAEMPCPQPSKPKT